MKNFKNIADFWSILLPGFVILCVLLAWDLLASLPSVEDWVLPRPGAVIAELWLARELIVMHSWRTIFETLLGFGAALTAAVFLATLTDVSVRVRQAVYPLLVISQTIPYFAVAPLLIIWLGYGILPKVLIVALVCFFPITINLADGFRNTDPDMIKLLSSMGASRRQIFFKVKVPATLPSFFTGMRIGGTYAVLGAVIAEWLGGDRGLGILLTRSMNSYLTDRMFASIIVITVLSLTFYGLIELSARLLMPWKRRKSET